MLLSSLYVRARDVDPIWDVMMQAMFYATPIFYTLDVVQEKTGSDLVPKILISLWSTLYRLKMFTTRSKRIRGEYPKRVPFRKMIGDQLGPAMSRRTASALTFDTAYVVSGVTGPSSSSSSDAPP